MEGFHPFNRKNEEFRKALNDVLNRQAQARIARSGRSSAESDNEVGIKIPENQNNWKLEESVSRIHDPSIVANSDGTRDQLPLGDEDDPAACRSTDPLFSLDSHHTTENLNNAKTLGTPDHTLAAEMLNEKTNTDATPTNDFSQIPKCLNSDGYHRHGKTKITVVILPSTTAGNDLSTNRDSDVTSVTTSDNQIQGPTFTGNNMVDRDVFPSFNSRPSTFETHESDSMPSSSESTNINLPETAFPVARMPVNNIFPGQIGAAPSTRTLLDPVTGVLSVIATSETPDWLSFPWFPSKPKEENCVPEKKNPSISDHLHIGTKLRNKSFRPRQVQKQGSTERTSVVTYQKPLKRNSRGGLLNEKNEASTNACEDPTSSNTCSSSVTTNADTTRVTTEDSIPMKFDTKKDYMETNKQVAEQLGFDTSEYRAKGKKIKCYICMEKEGKQLQYAREAIHLHFCALHSFKTSYQCPVCENLLSSDCNLTNHIIKQHPTKAKEYFANIEPNKGGSSSRRPSKNKKQPLMKKNIKPRVSKKRTLLKDFKSVGPSFEPIVDGTASTHSR